MSDKKDSNCDLPNLVFFPEQVVADDETSSRLRNLFVHGDLHAKNLIVTDEHVHRMLGTPVAWSRDQIEAFLTRTRARNPAEYAALVEALGYDDQSTGKPSAVIAPPGAKARDLVRTVFGERISERVFDQTIADMREEYFSALASGETSKARFALARGYLSLVVAALAQLRLSTALKVLGAIQKLV